MGKAGKYTCNIVHRSLHTFISTTLVALQYQPIQPHRVLLCAVQWGQRGPCEIEISAFSPIEIALSTP